MTEHIELRVNIKPQHQRNVFAVRVVDKDPVLHGFSSCSRLKMFACKVRNYAVLMRTINVYGLEVPSTFLPGLNRCSTVFVTTSLEKVDKLYEEADALGLYVIDVFYLPTITLHYNERIPISEIPN